eukprot:m.41991 g.41991  ORF g.41991 m.41991 type:complete len:447 (-) comp12846_c0_seq1:853-2193(-)
MGASESKADDHVHIQPALQLRYDRLLQDNDVVTTQTVADLISTQHCPGFGAAVIKSLGLELDQVLLPGHYGKLAMKLLGLDHAHATDNRIQLLISSLRGEPIGLAEATISKTELQAFWQLVLLLGLSVSTNDEVMKAEDITAMAVILTDSVPVTEAGIPLLELSGWCQQHLPRAISGAFKRIELQLTALEPDTAWPHTIEWFIPALETKGFTRQLVHQPQAWQLTSMLPEMYLEADSWQLLYSSTDHGQSANRLQHHAFQYRGPTLLVVRTLGKEVYVVAADEEWREDRTVPWGGPHTRLYRLAPTMAAVHQKPGLKISSDIKTRHKEHGFGFGTEPTEPTTAMLWLNADLSAGRCSCHSTQPKGVHVDIAIGSVEVWGCGGDQALSGQERERRRDQMMVEQRQKARRPRASEWLDSPDRAILDMGGALKAEDARIDIKHARTGRE